MPREGPSRPLPPGADWVCTMFRAAMHPPSREEDARPLCLEKVGAGGKRLAAGRWTRLRSRPGLQAAMWAWGFVEDCAMERPWLVLAQPLRCASSRQVG